MAAHPAARLEIEELLDSKGAVYQFYDELDSQLIDVAKSLGNQARISAPINSEQVLTYEEGMKRGDHFPAIVVYQAPAGKYIVIDGNHRVAAALATGYKLAAYVVDSKKTPAQVIRILTFEANAKHGLPTSQTERARHAVYLIENANETIKNAAARMNLPTQYVSRYYAAYRADARAVDTGVPEAHWRDLHVGSRERLNSLVDDNVFKAAVELCFLTRMTATEVTELVTHLRTLKTSEEQVRYVLSQREAQAERVAQVAIGEVRPRRQRLSGPRQSLRSGLYMLDSLVGDKRESMMDALTPLEAKEYIERLDHANTVIAELREAMEQKAAEL